MKSLKTIAIFLGCFFSVIFIFVSITTYDAPSLAYSTWDMADRSLLVFMSFVVSGIVTLIISVEV